MTFLPPDSDDQEASAPPPTAPTADNPWGAEFNGMSAAEIGTAMHEAVLGSDEDAAVAAGRADPHLAAAKEIVTEKQYASLSVLQRALHIPMGRADRLLKAMAADGHIIPREKTGRYILASHREPGITAAAVDVKVDPDAQYPDQRAGTVDAEPSTTRIEPRRHVHGDEPDSARGPDGLYDYQRQALNSINSGLFLQQFGRIARRTKHSLAEPPMIDFDQMTKAEADIATFEPVRPGRYQHGIGRADWSLDSRPPVEPWSIGQHPEFGSCIVDAHGAVVHLSMPSVLNRVIACVNHLAGIPTGALSFQATLNVGLRGQRLYGDAEAVKDVARRLARLQEADVYGMQWETAMMAAIGQDGIKDVVAAIEALQERCRTLEGMIDDFATRRAPETDALDAARLRQFLDCYDGYRWRECNDKREVIDILDQELVKAGYTPGMSEPVTAWNVSTWTRIDIARPVDEDENREVVVFIEDADYFSGRQFFAVTCGDFYLAEIDPGLPHLDGAVLVATHWIWADELQRQVVAGVTVGAPEPVAEFVPEPEPEPDLHYKRVSTLSSANPTTEPEKFAYYHRYAACPAPNSAAPDCCCWYQQGTGPRPTEVPSASVGVRWREIEG